MDISFKSLDTFLSTYSGVTSAASPLTLNITDTTAENWLDSAGVDTVGSILLNYPDIYFDLSSTIISDDTEEMDSSFENCRNLVKGPNIPETVSNLSECFKNCVSLSQAPSIADGVSTMYGTFYGCTQLTVGPKIPSTVTSMQYCFYNCTSLVIPSDIPNGVANISNCFRGCSSMTSAPLLGQNVSLMNGCFQGCTALVSGPDIPDSVTNLSNAFSGCSTLTTVGHMPSSLSRATSNVFTGCASLYNAGIWREASLSKVKNLFGTGASCNVRAIAILADSLVSTVLGKITSGSLKIYTTAEHFDALSASVTENYPGLSYEVIQADACLDYNEIKAYMIDMKENTPETAAKLFIGGGLRASLLQGVGWYYGAYNSSDFAKFFYRKNKYVDLSYLCLSKDTSSLRSTFCPVPELGPGIPSSTTIAPFIVRVCEIPDQVIELNRTFEASIIESFGNNNLVPSTVTSLSDAFTQASKMKDVYIEHKINGSYYIYDDSQSTYKVYVKDYSHLYKNSKSICDARRAVLECDYSDLDTYLSWLSTSCEDINLKVNNLTDVDLQADTTSSPFKPSALCSHLLGTYVNESLPKGFCASSTFDLRLTRCPSNITQLDYTFTDGNLSYSFEIPEKVISMVGTFESNSLKKYPKLPDALIDMRNCFSYNSTCENEPPVIPLNVRYLNSAFATNTNLKTMPEIPQYVKNMNGAFSSTSIMKTTFIPESVVNMGYCFSFCKNLAEIKNIPSKVEDISSAFIDTAIKTVPNIPSSVTSMYYTFLRCSNLTDVYNWDLDVTKNGLDMNSAFKDCSSLSKIHTTSKAVKKEYDSSAEDTKWRHITVKPTNYGTYYITCRDLKGTVSSKQISASDIVTYFTDEIIFSPKGALADSYITDMLSYRLPFGLGLDPAKKNFVIWAADASAVKTNITSSEETDITALQEEVTALKAELAKSVKLTAFLAKGQMALSVKNEAIKQDMMVTLFTSEYGVLPESVSVENGRVIVMFDENHEDMTVGIKLEAF